VSRALVLVDHGSRLAAANEVVESVGRRLQQRLADRIVEVAHMELVEPTLAEAIRRCAERGAREVVVCPYFLGPGRHTSDDIPRIAREASRGHPELQLRIAEPLGFDERLVDLVLERADATRPD
jgi:sirohydrochlorin ferrochelatase